MSLGIEEHDLTISASQNALVDLDEYMPCKQFAELIKSSCEGKDLRTLTLDLQQCWLEYSFSYLFLDVAITALQNSRASIGKRLEILVSVDLGETHFMATLLFRMSKVLSCENEADPATLLKKIQDYCAGKSLSIIVKSRIAKSEAGADENHEFIIGEPK